MTLLPLLLKLQESTGSLGVYCHPEKRHTGDSHPQSLEQQLKYVATSLQAVVKVLGYNEDCLSD